MKDGEKRNGEKLKLKKTERLRVEKTGVRSGQSDGEVWMGEGTIGAVEGDVCWDEATCESIVPF